MTFCVKSVYNIWEEEDHFLCCPSTLTIYGQSGLDNRLKMVNHLLKYFNIGEFVVDETSFFHIEGD